VRLVDPDGKSPCPPGVDCGPTPSVAGILYEGVQMIKASIFNSGQRVKEFLAGKGMLSGSNEPVTRMRVNFGEHGEIPLSNPTTVSQEPRKGFWGETGDILLDNIAMGSLSGFVGGRGALAAPVLAAKTPSSIIPSVARRFGDFQCVECADAILAALKKEGIEDAKIISLQAKGRMDTRSGNVWSDTAQRTISTNGHHRGVLIDGKVYDNIHKQGVDVDTWKNDFHSIEGIDYK
jgi:hypothetical protein